MSAVVLTGMDEFRRAVAAMPAAVQAELREAATLTARTIRNEALRDIPKSANGVHSVDFLIDDNTRDQVVMVFDVVRHPKPANLPLWLEFGTVKMAARPFFFPAVNRARNGFPDRIDRALQTAFDATVNK